MRADLDTVINRMDAAHAHQKFPANEKERLEWVAISDRVYSECGWTYDEYMDSLMERIKSRKVDKDSKT